MIRRENKMSSRLKHGLLISAVIIAFFFAAEHGYGTVIEYIYDAKEKRYGSALDS
jgi:hypothetical protein